MAKVSLNGRSFSGGNISIVGSKVYIDGKLVEGDLGIVNNTLDVKITEGTLNSLEADGSVDVADGVRILGSVSAGGSVDCDCVGGSVSAGGSIRCGRIGGSASAGGSIRHA